MKPPEAKSGEIWSYRARRSDPLVAVEVVKIGTQRPARVLAKFLAAESEGREEWVPPARLKTLWQDADAFIARERRWQAVEEASLPYDAPEESAAHVVFYELISEAIAAPVYGSPGVALISDIDALAALLDMDAAELRDSPLAFEDEDGLIVPWAVTERIVRRAAQRDPDPVLREVEKQEREQHQKMIHGHHHRDSRGGLLRFIEPEWYVEQDAAPYNRPARELLRAWCGEEAAQRWDELKALREEVPRLARLVEQAVAALRRAGVEADAIRIEHELGIPVEAVKQ